MKINWDVKTKKATLGGLETGVFGQISFGRLIKTLVEAGEISQDETITNLVFDFDMDYIKYKVVRKQGV